MGCHEEAGYWVEYCLKVCVVLIEKIHQGQRAHMSGGLAGICSQIPPWKTPPTICLPPGRLSPVGIIKVPSSLRVRKDPRSGLSSPSFLQFLYGRLSMLCLKTIFSAQFLLYNEDGKLQGRGHMPTTALLIYWDPPGADVITLQRRRSWDCHAQPPEDPKPEHCSFHG